MSDKKWTVYVYHFLDDDTRYVGKTGLTLKERQGSNFCSYKKSLRDKLLQRNFETTTYECSTNEEACYLENYLILFYNTMNPKNGHNRQGGGDRGYTYCDESKLLNVNAHTGKKASDETRAKMRKSHVGERNGMYGKHQSDETRRKISETKRRNRLLKTACS